MSGPAQVRSTDAIERVSVALARFAHRVTSALDTVDGELHRADSWIDHDRPAHWKKQIRDAEDGLHEAKLELERCLLATTVDGQRPACREQKAAVAKAKARLEYCREKVDIVKKWQRSFRHEALEFKGRMGQLRRAVDHDVPHARALLEKILRRIEEYQLERPPEAFGTGAPAESGGDETYARRPEPAAETAAQQPNSDAKSDDASAEAAEPQPEADGR